MRCARVPGARGRIRRLGHGARPAGRNRDHDRAAVSETSPQDYPRLHFDLHVPNAAEQEAEADRLLTLGAVRVGWDSYPDDPDFIVLADTEGNRFCIVDLGHESHESV